MTELFRIIGVGMCALVTAVVLREVRREFVPVFTSVFIAASAVMILPVIAEGAEIIKKCASVLENQRVIPALKALGTAYLVSTAAQLCRSLGEGGIASALENVGKAEILLLSLPLFGELLELASLV